MTDSKTIDLIIQAQLKGKGDLATITKGIADLEKALEAQSQAAKAGESSIDQLKATLLELEKVSRNLKTSASLAGEFEKLPGKIDRANTSINKHKTAYDKLIAAQEAGKDLTEKQGQRLDDLGKKYANAQRYLEGLTKRQTDLRDQLQALGADTNNLAGFQNDLRKTAADLGVVYGKTNQAISTYAEDVRSAREATKAAAQAQKDATRDAELFEKAEKRAAEAAAQRAADQQKYLNRPSAEIRNAVSQGNEAEVARVREIARQRELAALQESITKRTSEQAAAQADAQAKLNGVLAKTADDAQKAAQSYTTLARASNDLTPAVGSLRDILGDIQAPSRKVISSLSGVEGKVTELSATISKIEGPVKNYRETLVQLNETQRALANQAGLIDAYRRQVDAVRKAREEFVQARAKVNEYAAAVRQGGEAGQQFVRSLNEAQVAAQRAAAGLNAQLQSARQARQGLRDAGIASNDLAAAQTRLINTSKQAKQATDDLGAAVNKYGNEVEKSGRKRNGIFGDEGRTTLSLAQRIRGEILALAAAYVGLQGAISTATSALDAFKKREATKTVIGVGLQTTDKAQIDAEYTYVKAQSERIGLVFDDTAKQYGKFAASAAAAGRNRKEIKYIFEAFAEGGRVLKLSTDDMNGVFTALQQIFNKGKLSAEELNQQLGERLPAVFAVAQEALKDQFPDLAKAMANGQVGAENLVLIAQKYREMVANQLPSAIGGLEAQQARMTNAVNDFKLAIADAGFADAYTKAIARLTEFLKSDDGQEFAKNLSGAFEAVLDVLMLLVENFDTLTVVIKALLAFQVAKVFIDMATGLTAVSTAAKGAAGSLTLANKALGVLTAAIAGWAIGTMLREKFASVRVAAVLLVTYMDEAWTRIKYGTQLAFEAIPRVVTNMAVGVENIFKGMIRKIGGLLESFLKMIGNEKLAAAVGSMVSDVVDTQYKREGERAAKLRQQMKAEIANIERLRKDMIAYERNPSSAPAPGEPDTPTPFPGKGPNTRKPNPKDDAEVAKRERQVDAIRDRLDALDARINRASSQTLENQLSAVDLQTNALKADIEKLADTGVKKAFMDRLTTLRDELRAQIQTNFSDEIANEQEALQSRLEQAEAAAGRKVKESLDKRLVAIEKSYADAFRRIDELIAKQKANNLDTGVTVQIRTNMVGAVDELKTLEAKKFYEEEINRVIGLRKDQIAAVAEQEKNSLITRVQAEQQVNTILAQTNPLIEKAKNDAIAWAMANGQIFNNPAAQQQFVDSITAVGTKAQAAKNEFDIMGNAISGSLGAALDSLGGSLVDMMSGQKSVGEGFQDMATAALGFFAGFMRDIALAIAKMYILKAIQAAIGGPAGAAIGGVAHDGGIVGSLNRSRAVSPAWFTAAPRYHTGGIVGLAPDEYPAILQKGEEVLKASDSRNILNGGAAAGGGTGDASAGGAGVRFVLVDERSKVPEAMNSSEGDRVIVQSLKRNAATIKQLLR